MLTLEETLEPGDEVVIGGHGVEARVVPGFGKRAVIGGVALVKAANFEILGV